MVNNMENYWDRENWLKVKRINNDTIFYLNEKLHRNDGPALIKFYENGVNERAYYYNGKLHRNNDPAKIVTRVNGNILKEAYYFNGKIHRNNGPAVVWYHKDVSIKKENYFFNGIMFNPENLPFELPIDTKEKEFMFYLKFGQ